MDTTAPVVQTTPGGKGKRTRQVLAPLTALPPLSGAQQVVLLKWLKSDAGQRSWQSLLDLAGASHLDVAYELLQALLLAAAVAVKEELRHGQWRPWRVVWLDLEAVQRLANVSTRAEREASKENLNVSLRAMAEEHSWLSPAVHSLLNDRLTAATRAARMELLKALVLWQQAQRQGLRRMFALAARNRTKAITDKEWDWLESYLPLESLGIGQFEALLWLGGAIVLGRADDATQGTMDLRHISFVGMPCKQFCASLRVVVPPQSYWLIENRASFERQAQKLPAGVCLVWLPGRPSSAWLTAMGWLLSQAPAPASISCDPDPAGIQIAMTAGELWEAVGLKWQASHMASGYWQTGKTLPLTDYDHGVLAQLQACGTLPAELATLRDFILSSGSKAEQEGWL